MRPKRIGGVNPAIQLIMAVFLLVVGILMITAPESFIRWLFLIVSVGMAAFGFMSLISAVFGKNGTRLGSLISGILYIVISIVILTQKDFFQAAVSRIFSLLALVQAVKNDSSSNVLSTPSITTLDNQEAFFMVGQDVPVLTGSTVGSNNSNPFNTVERKKVGIMLKVTPQINEGNAVQMVIEQEVSKVEGHQSRRRVWRAQTENHRAGKRW